MIIVGFALMVSCKKNDAKYKPKVDAPVASSVHSIKVKEVLQTSSYTYLFVTEDNKDYWIAVGKIDVEAGASLSYSSFNTMKDFKSKELDRVFHTILFVSDIKGDIKSSSPHGSLSNEEKQVTKSEKAEPIAPPSGGISFVELYTNRDKYSGKKVKVKGKVVKINRNIMNRNWVHLQDGTLDKKTRNITLTSTDDMKVGDIVTMEGTVSLNKAFGGGYDYELIIEGASLK